jgi:hypothetical protein
MTRANFPFTGQVYPYSHSFITFGIVFLIAWIIYRRPRFELLGWALHIFIDIFTHPAAFYPTPFLFPISSYKFLHGVAWSEKWFMITNYSTMLLVWASMMRKNFLLKNKNLAAGNSFNRSLGKKFESIAKGGGWKSDGTTISGGGSTIEINKYRTKFLSDFIKDYGITHIIDIPCGDANWQHSIPDLDKISYFGSDISTTALNSAKNKNKHREYMKFSEKPIDLTENVLKIKNGEKTLIIIKEVIQHLPLQQGMKMLKNAKKSGIKYIAVTNHDTKLFNVEKNIDVTAGGFYPNNIFLEPFNFKNPIRDINESLNDDLQAGYGNLIIFDLGEQEL